MRFEASVLHLLMMLKAEKNNVVCDPYANSPAHEAVNRLQEDS